MRSRAQQPATSTEAVLAASSQLVGQVQRGDDSKPPTELWHGRREGMRGRGRNKMQPEHSSGNDGFPEHVNVKTNIGVPRRS